MDVAFDVTSLAIAGLASVVFGIAAPLASIAALVARRMRGRMIWAGAGAVFSLLTLLILMSEPSPSARLRSFEGLQVLNVFVALAAAVRAALA
jgi:hypothetical protein